MEYSEEISKIKLDYYLTLVSYFLIIIVALILIGILLKKVYIGTNNFKEFSTKYWVHYVLIILIIIGSIFWSTTSVKKDLFRDLENVRNNIYIVDECLVISPSNAGNSETYQERYPQCKSLISGEEYFLSTFYSPINEGELYKVIYLENTKIGRIILKIE